MNAVHAPLHDGIDRARTGFRSPADMRRGWQVVALSQARDVIGVIVAKPPLIDAYKAFVPGNGSAAGIARDGCYELAGVKRC